MRRKNANETAASVYVKTLNHRRPYQREAIQAVLDHLSKGVMNQLVVIGMGGGKTIIGADLPKAVGMKPYEQMFWLVHLDTMAKQAAETFQRVNPDLMVEIEKAEQWADPDADIIIASVQTLGRKGSDRLKRFNPDRARIIACDEIHHASRRDGQYAEVFRYFRVLKGESNYDGKKLLIGLTGTPNRYDNIGLESILDKIVYEKGVEELVNEKWLAEMHCFRVSTGHSVAGVAIKAGDFAIRQLERAVNTEARNRLVVRKYCEVGEGLPGLAFTVDVQHSHDLSETFNRLGIPAAAVSGKTPSRERDRLREAHRNREIAVLTSCGTMNEGADFPWATIGLMCRPTRSPNFYWQQACRVDRLYPAPEDIDTHQDAYSKDHAIIVDFVDNSGRHPLIEIASLFGLRSGFDAKGKSIAEAAQEIAALESKQPALNLRACLSLDEVQSAIERVEIFRPPVVPAEARKHSKYAWIEAGPDTYHLALPSRILLVMHVNTLGQREIYQSTAGVRRLMGVHRDPAEAFLHADRLVPREHERLVKAKMKWRCAEPTQAQCEFLFRLDPALHKKFGNPKMLYDFAATQFQAGNLSYSRGQISQMIAARKTAEGYA